MAHLPDCMMPDGAEPCLGYREVVQSAKRRLFLLTGWGRFLTQLTSLREAQEHIKKTREGGDWAICISDDYWALLYQRIDYRIARAKHAFGAYGLTGHGTFTSEGMRWASKSEIADMNREAFHRHYRQRAHEATKKLRELERYHVDPTWLVEEDRTRDDYYWPY